MTHLELRAQLTIRPGELEGFKAQVAEIMRLTRELDTQTLRYDWFISADGTECEVHEAYESEAGLFEHNQHIMDARAELFAKYANGHRMTAYGEVSQQLIDLATRYAGGLTRYSFLQGLELEPAVLRADRRDHDDDTQGGLNMTRNRELLARAVEIYNAGDLDAYVDLYTDDAVLTTPEGAFKGHAEIRERFARELAAFSDVRFTLVSYIESGDLFADEFIFTGTHTGPFALPDGATLAPSGTRVEIRGMEIVQVRDGKMAVDNLYYDNVTVYVQLGLTSAPVPA